MKHDQTDVEELRKGIAGNVISQFPYPPTPDFSVDELIMKSKDESILVMNNGTEKGALSNYFNR